MLPVIIAIAGSLAIGAAMGSSATKSNILSKPTYLAIINYKNGTIGTVEGTLLGAWTAALTEATKPNSTVATLELRAPDGTTIRRWPT